MQVWREFRQMRNPAAHQVQHPHAGLPESGVERGDFCAGRPHPDDASDAACRRTRYRPQHPGGSVPAVAERWCGICYRHLHAGAVEQFQHAHAAGRRLRFARANTTLRPRVHPMRRADGLGSTAAGPRWPASTRTGRMSRGLCGQTRQSPCAGRNGLPRRVGRRNWLAGISTCACPEGCSQGAASSSDTGRRQCRALVRRRVPSGHPPSMHCRPPSGGRSGWPADFASAGWLQIGHGSGWVSLPGGIPHRRGRAPDAPSLRTLLPICARGWCGARPCACVLRSRPDRAVPAPGSGASRR
jgi:hypothetical protein